MKKAKLGRNDPCPCGSGKKYKHCCQVLEGIATNGIDPFERYNTLMTSIKMKLEHNYAAQIRKIRRPAQEQFLRLSCDQTLPREQESVFSDWLWFDMTDNQGMTLGREYLQEHGDYMEAPLRECLQSLNQSYLSVYGIDSAAGDNLRLNDYLSGEVQQVLLKEPLELDLEEARPLLLGRLAAMPGGTVFSGMVLMVGDDKGQGRFIRQHLDYWQQVRPDLNIAALRKGFGEVIFGLFDHASHTTTLALNDIRCLPAGAAAAELRHNIENTTAFIPVHHTAGTAWYDLQDSRGPARVGISDDGPLLFYADVVDDIQAAEPLLRFQEAGWTIVNSQLRLAPPEEEHNDAWYQVIRERETERWLHTAHSELDNKTPAQVLAEAEGKGRLLQVLDTFAARASHNQHTLDLLAYMRSRVA